MRKSNFLIFMLILILSAFCAVILTGCAPRPELEQGNFSEVLNRKLPAIQAGDDNKIEILQLTDTHFIGNTKKDEITYQAIEKIIKDGNYDLVVITGDMLDGYNNSRHYDKPYSIDKIAALFESLGQYWTFVAGNNDGEYCGNNQAVFSALAKYEHCLVSDSGVGGVGNFMININDSSDQLAHTLFFMDSRMRDDNGNMLPIDNTQIDWYRDNALLLRELEVKTSLFMHIPFREFADAYNNGEIINTYNNHASTLDINVNEDSSRLLDAILEIGNNGLIGTGHTHGSDYLRFYQNMYWLQVRACGENAWNDGLPRGGASIVIDIKAKELKNMYHISDVNFN